MQTENFHLKIFQTVWKNILVEMRKVSECPVFRFLNLNKLRIVHAPTIVIRTVHGDQKPESFENFQKLTYRRIWDREIVGEESSDEDESYLNEKQLKFKRRQMSKFVDYAFYISLKNGGFYCVQLH